MVLSAGFQRRPRHPGAPRAFLPGARTWPLAALAQGPVPGSARFANKRLYLVVSPASAVANRMGVSARARFPTSPLPGGSERGPDAIKGTVMLGEPVYADGGVGAGRPSMRARVAGVNDAEDLPFCSGHCSYPINLAQEAITVCTELFQKFITATA